MGAHPFLTLTLFIAMFERDHGPLEYQMAYGAAMKHLTLPYPDIATWTPCAPPSCTTAQGAPPCCTRSASPDARYPGRRAGQSLVRVTAAPIVPLDLLCASGTSYFGRRRCRTCPACRGSVWWSASETVAPGTRVWFATSAGMAPGDGSLAELCAVADDDLVPLETDVPDTAGRRARAVRGRRLDGADLARRAPARRAGARARRRRGGRPGRDRRGPGPRRRDGSSPWPARSRRSSGP